MRRIPFEEDQPLFLCEFAGKWEDVCPRGVLRRVLGQAAEMGYDVAAAAEFEFFVFEETPDTVREKNCRDLRNITPGFFGILEAGVRFSQDFLASDSVRTSMTFNIDTTSIMDSTFAALKSLTCRAGRARPEERIFTNLAYENRFSYVRIKIQGSTLQEQTEKTKHGNSWTRAHRFSFQDRLPFFRKNAFLRSQCRPAIAP